MQLDATFQIAQRLPAVNGDSASMSFAASSKRKRPIADVTGTPFAMSPSFC